MAQKAFFGFLIAVTMAFSFALWSASAATISPAGESLTQTVSQATDTNLVATTAATLQSEYTLPYPGILPDHPLYKVKLFRDRLLDFLIRDPLKRSEFNLLMADKRLNMGMYLTEKEEYDLAEETVSKGEKYFVLALDEVKKAKDQGREVPRDLIQKLQTATTKHREVVTEIKSKSPENKQHGYDSSLQLISENSDRAMGFGQ